MPEKEVKESDFIATARKRFEAADSDEKEIRKEAIIDLNFVAGDQWDAKLKQDRESAGRPALTFPRCHTFVQQVSNEARQNKPQIKFAPTDDKADDDTAEIYEGLARHIQYESDAQIAYETSVECSAGGSFGFFRYLTVENDNGDQDLVIKPVLDPFAVYGVLYPACFGREPRYAFVVEDMPKEEFEDTYPKSSITQGGLGSSDSSWLSNNGWMGTDTVRVAEYWYCEGQGKDTKVKFCKISGMEVLPESKTDWLGYCIPIIPVLGKGMIIQGKAKLFSVVRYQRSAQVMINYSKSRIAETLSTAPISPFLAAQGQITKGDKKWENLNTQNFPYLEYNSVDVNGKPAPPPQRQTFEPPIQALSEFVQQEIDDMKATTGIFDASLGQKSNETSSVAITNRQQQSSMTTMHFMDNLERAFKKGGKIMEDIFPKIYDTKRIIRILGPDESAKVVKINAPYQTPGAAPGSKPEHYKMGGDDAGKYSAIVTMGRAFSTKRMESFDMMQGIVQGNPQLLQVIGDIMFRNSDVAGADELADRFKKMLPPNLQDNDQGDPANQLQQAQAQLSQLTQAHQQLNAYAQQLEKEKEGKVVEQQGKAQITQMQEATKQEIVKMQEATRIAVAQINASKDANQAFAEQELAQYKLLHDTAHDVAMQHQEHAHAQQLAAQQAAVAQQSQAADQQHDAESQAADQSHEATMADVGHAQTLEQQQAAAELQPAGGNQGE